MKLTPELTAKLRDNPSFVGAEMIRLLEESRKIIRLEEMDKEYEINVFGAAIQWTAHLLAKRALDVEITELVLVALGAAYAMGRVDERALKCASETVEPEEATADNRGGPMEDFLSSLFERGNGKDV